MRPGREIDTKIATEVFGHKVWARGKVLYENPAQGDRPLRNYSREMEWAWQVAEKMKVSLLPIEGGQWFAFIGPLPSEGWASPEAMLKFLEAKTFDGCGAAVGDDVPFIICEAALKAVEKREGDTAKLKSVANAPAELKSAVPTSAEPELAVASLELNPDEAPRTRH